MLFGNDTHSTEPYKKENRGMKTNDDRPNWTKKKKFHMSCIAYLSHIVAYVAKLKRNACWEKKKKENTKNTNSYSNENGMNIFSFFSNTLSFFPWCLCVTLTTNRSSRFAYNRKAKMRLETFVVCKTKAFLKCYLYAAVAFVFDNILTILFSIRFGAVTSFPFLLSHRMS